MDVRRVIEELIKTLDADVFFYSGEIDREAAEAFRQAVDKTDPKRKNAALVLCTLGGDADSAFIITRYLKSHYEKLTLYVLGLCKSAGTLVALGSDEIVMSPRGELGPLDVQLLKADDFVERNSGLDILQAFQTIGDQAFQIFEKTLLELVRKSGGALSTKTAAHLAINMAVGIMSPIAGQIDPIRISETERAVAIAFHYGRLLNPNNQQKVQRLIHNYPAHTFVIDLEEAKTIFENVRKPTELETQFEKSLGMIRTNEGEELKARVPSSSPVILRLKFEPDTEKDVPDEKLDKQDSCGSGDHNDSGITETGGNHSETGSPADSLEADGKTAQKDKIVRPTRNRKQKS